MGPFNDHIYAKGPAMILPPPQDQLLTPDASMESSPLNTQDTSSSYPNHSTAWTPTPGKPPLSTNPSRKRSRDEGSFDIATADGSYFPSQAVTTTAAIPEEEPIYGEGMTLLNPRTGVSVSAESQTGTWYEEKVETEANKPRPEDLANGRPELPLSRKSQRLDSTAPGLDDLAQSALPASPPKSTTAPTDPSIDTFTLSLGIGWTRLCPSPSSSTTDPDPDPAMQAAARGWARYIDNHYEPYVHNAQILLKSKGLNAYLVGAAEGFFLFSDDLMEARFVAPTWDQALHGLRATPIQLQGEEVLRAAERTPGPETAAAPPPPPPPSTTAAAAATTTTNGISTVEPKTMWQDGGNGSWSMDGGGCDVAGLAHSGPDINGATATAVPGAGAGGMELD